MIHFIYVIEMHYLTDSLFWRTLLRIDVCMNYADIS